MIRKVRTWWRRRSHEATKRRDDKGKSRDTTASQAHGDSEVRMWMRRIVVIVIVLLLPIGVLIGRVTAPKAETALERDIEPAAAETIEEERETIYYCPMHPNQTSTDPDAPCPICGMDLVARDDDDDDDDAELPRLRVSERSAALMDIATWPAERRFVEREVRLYGMIEPDERREKAITAWIDGRIEQLHVDFTGARVEQGEPMVELYSPPLISAQEELFQSIRAAARHTNASDRARESAQRTIEASRERLRLLGLGREQIASIEERGEVQETITIAAPIGGTVIARNISEGEYVQTGDPLYRVADLTRLWLQLEAYELDLPWLMLGQPVMLTTQARPGESFDGEITFIDPVLDRAKRTARVRVEVENPDGRLKPGMFAHGIALSTLDHEGRAIALVDDEARDEVDAEPPLVIPRTAPLITGERAVVYVKMPEEDRPTFEARQITLGPRAGDHYLVRDGISEGDLVVKRGQFKIDSELQIRGRPSMMAPEGEPPPMHHHDHEHDHVAIPDDHAAFAIDPADVDAAFQSGLEVVFDWYIELANALADDDFDRSHGAVFEMHEALLELEHDRLEGDVRDAWDDVDHQLHEALHAMYDAENIDGIRDHLEHLSEYAAVMVAHFIGDRAGPVYRVHCPMAFDDAGADWLQRVRDVANPYFGSMMFRCGTVTETIIPDADDLEREEDEVEPAESDEPFEVPDHFTERLAAVYDAYFAVQEALADDDFERSREALPELIDAADALDTSDLTGPAADRWRALHEKLMLDVDDALETNDIEVFRTHFESWANAAIEISRTFGHAEDEPHYVAHCPMAFDFRGADWLQRGETINNSYFGATMLRCGTIEDELTGKPEGGAR